MGKYKHCCIHVGYMYMLIIYTCPIRGGDRCTSYETVDLK